MRTILLAGGGTGGSVSPLLAVATELKQLEPAVKFLFVGTRNGPERLMSEKANIAFVSIPAGKYRRYFSLKNFLTPILILAGLVKSLLILKKYKPACVFGCGSFVQVPVIWAAWMYNIPIIIHQQDIIPSLANSLCQIVAKKITVAFEISIKDFSSDLGIFYKGTWF